jgi:nicotinate-nucleotide adenylyltransferase
LKIGLFFGSFNPIHTGHLIIASYLVEYSDLQQIWFVVSPHNPLKLKKSLLNESDRLEMVRLAINDDSRLKASHIEFNLPQPSYTIDTLTYLHEKFPSHEFVLIMGSDSLKSLPKWKNYQLLLEKYQIYVYPRPGEIFTPDEKETQVKVFDAPLMKISATHIRNSIKNGRSIKYLVPDSVITFIDKWGLYS